jgi:pimeloyl-ACP methyl ester carboxylesterase
MRDVLPDDPSYSHFVAKLGSGLKIHYVRAGQQGGHPLLLLHGWPGFWYDWRHVIPLLAATGEFDIIAPDFRGFGASDKPRGPAEDTYTTTHLGEDIEGLLAQLGLSRVTIVAHDIGASVGMPIARRRPDLVRSLVLMDPAYPGVGARRFDPKVASEFWYQHFHGLPWAEELVGRDNETIRLYVTHFYEHWTGDKSKLKPRELEAVVRSFQQPGCVYATMAYYRGRIAERKREIGVEPAQLITKQPTSVLWGELDPVMRLEWSDRLGEFFPNLIELKKLPGVGHFVPFEAPSAVAEAIVRHRSAPSVG